MIFSNHRMLGAAIILIPTFTVATLCTWISNGFTLRNREKNSIELFCFTLSAFLYHFVGGFYALSAIWWVFITLLLVYSTCTMYQNRETLVTSDYLFPVYLFNQEGARAEFKLCNTPYIATIVSWASAMLWGIAATLYLPVVYIGIAVSCVLAALFIVHSMVRSRLKIFGAVVVFLKR